MAKENPNLSYNNIPNLDIDWESIDPSNNKPWSGASIERVIKSSIKDALKQASESSLNKIGAQWFDPSSFTMYHFKNVEDKRKWEESGQTVDDRDPSYLIGEPTILSFAGTLNRIQFVNPAGTTTLYFTTNANEANITVGFESQEKGITDTEWKEVSEDFVVSVSVDRGALGSYETFIADKQVLNGNTLTFDVRRYLATGSNRIKVTAKGVDSGAVANLTYQVTLTSMYLSPSNFTWYTPFIEGKTYNLGGMNIGGNLEKTLFVKVTKEGYEKLYEVAIGTNIYTDTAYIFKGLEFPEAGTGVYNVDIWLEAGTLQSEHLSYNIICVKADEQFTAKVVSIGNPTKVVYNFSDNELFEYCVYNGGQSSASPHLRLSTIINTNPNVIVDEDLVDVATSTPLKYVASLEVESQEAEIQLEAYMQYGNEQQVVFPIDNSKAFPATSGAVFYLNPSTRSNAQENKLNVVNSINSAEYTAEWNGMAWTDGMDGWTIDEEGRKCLRLPAFTNVNINYQPLSSVTAKTIEFVYKVKNASDYSDAIITICDDASKADFKGIKITPKNILVHSSQLNTQDSLQDYNAIDEEVLSVIVTIIPNYKTNYGNLCQIYCNGEKVRSFEYANSDSFATSANIIMGNDTADLFLYKMRVYNIGFEKNFAMKNFVNSLPDRATREAMNAELNSCVNDSMQLDYDTCVKNGYNTMVIEMLNGKDIPSLANQEAGLLCNLQIKINNIIEGELDEEMEALLTGTEIKNEVIEGQGTTAMTYPRWNFRWKLSKAYGKRRITAKKNVASSMQSHKMGATRLYNYLYSEIIGKNEVGGKVAVLQYPVFGFKKSLIDGTTNQYVYTPIGLYTIGADKGDKHTFGYDNAQYKNSIIHLEGADHTPKSVGFDYPYEATKFSSSAEAMGAINTDGTVIGAWEVGMAGKLENNVKADEEGVQEMLNAEWKPAYNVAYHNSPYVMGVSETIASINANVDEWRKGKTADDKSFTLFEIYNASDYALHYYDIQTKQYKPTGVNVLTDVGLTASAVSGMSLAEIDAKIIELRKARFVAEWGTYFHTDDAILHYTFCLIFGVTDNFKKNTYPYKFPFLANGGKWRWRVDDLDTLFDVINQGLATKQPDILVGDTDATGSIYVGDTSVLWTLIKETQTDEIKAMAHKIFSAMVSHPLAEGANTQAKLVGCIKHFFWDFAQNYFPASAYNVDVEWTYEDTWANKNSWKEVNPLSQALGGHFEAEKDWVTMRMLFMSSYFNFGAFTHTGYNDASTGQMVYGGADAHTFEITPAVSINPTIIRGSTETITYGDRVKANETASITVSDASGDDTRVYVQGLDYIKDLGDLKDLKVSAKNPTLSVASKRLQSLKVGDADASKVPTSGTISNLSFGDCPSLMVIDAQNLGTLTGIIDLSLLPRLREALFGGTNVKSINLPSGSKIERLQIPSSVTNLELIRCNNLQGLVKDSNFVYNQNAYIRTHYGIGSTISLIPESGSGFICTVIDCTKYEYFIISGTGYDWERLWCFVDEDNKIVSVAAPEITATDLKLKVPMNAKKLVINFAIKINPSYSLIGYKQGTIEYDTLPNVMTLRLENNATIDGFYILKGIYSTNNNALRYVRIVGFDYEGDANDVMMIANLATDKDKDGNYHSYNGISSEGVNQDETIPIIEGKLKVNGCIYEEDGITLKEFYPNLTLEVTGGYYVKFTDAEAQRICAETWGDGTGITNEQAKAVTSFGAKFKNNTLIESFDEFEKFTGMEMLGTLEWNSTGFYGCTSLKSIKLPPSLNQLLPGCLYGCTSLTDIGDTSHIKFIGHSFYGGAVFQNSGVKVADFPNLQTIYGYSNWKNSAIEEVKSLGQITTIPSSSSSAQYAFYNCTSLKKVTLPETFEHIQEGTFRGCSALESINFPPSLTRIDHAAFMDCASLNIDVVLPNLVSFGDGGAGAHFRNSGIKSIDFTGSTFTILSSTYSSGNGTFYSCKNLTRAILNEGLEDIQPSAFAYCSALAEVYLPKSLTKIQSTAFYENTSLTSVDLNLPNLTLLGESAFAYCSNLVIEDVNLPKLKQTGQHMFRNVKVKKISNLGELTSIEYLRSLNKNYIEEMNYPDGTTTSTDIFRESPLLKKVSANNLQSFSQLAFYNCKSLEEVNINWENVISLGYGTFLGCTKLSYDHINLANLTSMGESAFSGVKVTKMSLPSLTTTTNWSYGHKTFGEYEYLKEISCPNLTSIGKYAFYDYSKLENIDINWENITTLEYGAFANVPMSFDELRLTSLQKMGSHVFNIAKIKKIVLGNNSTQLVLSDSGTNYITFGDKDYLEEAEIYGTDTIPQYSFYNYSKLSKVKLPNNLWRIGNRAFYNCTSLNYDTLSFPELVILEENAFNGVKIRKMELNNITTLGAFAVGDKTTLEELTLSPNLTTLVYIVFGGYTNLSKINGLEGVTKFSRMSFSNCNKLKYLHFPNIITAGDDGNYEGAFSGSKNMNITLHLGASCKTIGAFLLSYCTDCSMAIICEATTPPEFGSSPFHASARTSFTGIYVPDEVVSSYQGATGWSAYADKIKGISDFLVDNTELYEEIKDSLVGLVKGMRILPKSTILFDTQLQLTCYYDGEIVTPQWTVEGDATIDTNGLLSFKAEGEVTVTATYNGVSKSMQYTYALAITEQAITTETLVRRQSNPNRWNWIVPNQDLKRNFNCSIKVLANSPIKAEIQIGTDPTKWSTSYNLYDSSWITAGNSKSINLNTYNKGTGTLSIGFANNSDNGFVTVDMIKQYVRILYWN